jgi:hypothetical protein
MKFISHPLTILVLGTAFLLACDLQKIGNQATAKSVAVGIILATPPVEIKAQAVALRDAGFNFPADSGIDAGALFADAGITVPGQNIVTLYFGQREGSGLDIAPTGTTGASVSLVEVGGPTFQLKEEGSGNYVAQDDAGFKYKSNATYTFNISHLGTTYVAEIEKTPTQETIAKFHDAPGFIEINANESVSFTRPDPLSGQDRQLGFINVFAINSSGGNKTATYSNIPTTPLGFLKLVVVPNEWKESVVTIPGTAFPSAKSNYVIVLQSAKLGGPKSDNLFSGSAILAGAADVGIVKTK